MNPVKAPLMVIGLLALMLVGASVFTVHETQRGIVLRLGNIITDSEGLPKVFQPGLRFKFPFMDSIRLFDTRIQTFDIQSERIITGEKKYLIVDVFVKWKVNNFAKFYTSTNGNVKTATNLLRENIIDGVRNEFGQRTIQEVIAGERQELMDQLTQNVQQEASNLGVEITDARVKRIDLPMQVSDGVFARMRSERHRVAEEHRAMGQSQAERIRATADAEATVILATAERDSKSLKGEGDAEAAKIYADVYGQDAEFYRFYRSMEAYKTSFQGKENLLLVEPNNDFFSYMSNYRHADKQN